MNNKHARSGNWPTLEHPTVLVASALLLLGAAKPGGAVGYALEGNVTDQASTPISGVSVRLAVAGAAALTDASGNWQLVQVDAQVLGRDPNAIHPSSTLFVSRGRVFVVVDGRLVDGRREMPSGTASPLAALSRSLSVDDTIVYSKPGYQVLRRPVGYGESRVDVQLQGAGTPGMVIVPGGTFSMGSEGVSGATPHEVTLDSFRIDITEVTRASYKALLGTDPSATSPGCDRCPVENLPWYEALRYCDARSAVEGRPAAYDISNSDSTKWTWIQGATGYRLPTEAEWEYAARGGSTGDWFWGGYTDSTTLSRYCWFQLNSGDSTHPVGLLQPNGYGLEDVAGNVWEWVWDWFQTPYPSVNAINPTGPDGRRQQDLQDHPGRRVGCTGGRSPGHASVQRSALQPLAQHRIPLRVRSALRRASDCP
jgi:formylglycine-generating enzyme required for sulfatase activity